MSFAKEVWETLSVINVNEHAEKKGNLTYLSWSWAWATLMAKYPESSYIFDDPVRHPDNTVEVWVTVSIRRGEDGMARRMWLPVMDHKNNAIADPDARKISDTRMRCLTKCLAMFGLGAYIYAGEDLPQAEQSKSPEEQYKELTEKWADSILAIKDGIRENQLGIASEAWSEMPEDVRIALWKAPTKGGCFTTQERAIMKSTEFREASPAYIAHLAKSQGGENVM